MPLVTFDDRDIFDGSIEVITGTFSSTSGQYVDVSYPTGFTQTNCVVIGLQVDLTSSSLGMRYGEGISSASDRTFVQLDSTKVRVYTNGSQNLSKPFKVTLYKYQ